MEALEEPERLSWEEICVRYPEQYVYLVDEIWGALGSGVNIKSARVLGNGPTPRSLLDLARERDRIDEQGSVQFTGSEIIQPRPLSWVLDDESIEFLRREPPPTFRLTRGR
jgi:hypothetical protein